LKICLKHNSLHLVPFFLIPFLFAIAVHAQAGPPFRTDDPETPGNKHWEINFGWLADRNPHEGSYSIPNFDFNYGLGDRIQLKYEVPIVVHEERGNSGEVQSSPPVGRHFAVGLGDSLLGIKWRFYQHKLTSPALQASDDEAPEANISVSTYPQLSLNNPTNSVHRDLASPGPQFLLPLEANTRIGPIRLDGEVGYWFTNRNVPQSWIRGIMIGHEFSRKTNAYLELYDEQDSNRVHGEAKKRETTLGLGARHGLNRDDTVLLMAMGGRSFQKVSSGNGQPSWIAYVGIQLLLGPK
jgi:hypothetical protein